MYNKKVFFCINQNDNIIVELFFFFIVIMDFNEVVGEIEMVVYLIVKWENEFLRWIIIESNMLRMFFFQDQLWKFIIVFFNLVEFFKEFGDKSYWICIDNDGNYEWQVGIVLKIVCFIDIIYYFFDKQFCNIIFINWGFIKDQVKFEFFVDIIDL